MNLHRCMSQSATSRGVRIARASWRLRSAKRLAKPQFLTPAQSLTLLGPLLQIRCSRGTSTSRTPCALTDDALVLWCPRVPSQHLHVSDVVAVLRPLMRGDRKFSSHDWVNELDTIGDHIANIAEIQSHAPGSEAWSSLWVALMVDAADS